MTRLFCLVYYYIRRARQQKEGLLDSPKVCLAGGRVPRCSDGHERAGAAIRAIRGAAPT